MRRLKELDALRGFMLVWITFTHLPTALSTYVNQPFGFVSAAEGFIFLSALFTGSIYFRMAEQNSYGAMRRKLSMRTLQLYLYHVLLLSFVFLVAVPIAASGTRPGLHNLLDFYFDAGARRAVVDAVLLIYRPPLLDILPMYIIFLALTPVALSASRRFGWKPILAGGFTLWLLAQFGLREASWQVMNRYFGLRIPLHEMGSFDLWAWQFLWLVGMWVGVCWARDQLDLARLARQFTIPALFVVSALLATRYAVGRGFELGSYELYFDKWHLGVVRLIDFTAIAVLLIRASSYLKPLSVRPLVLLGQSSLQVFCTHLLFCFAGLTLLGNASMLSSWKQFGLLATTVSAMLLTAKLFAKAELKPDVKVAIAAQKLPTLGRVAAEKPTSSVA
ncbi:MAG: acyltransferase [Acidobacteria bacterium]|nr:MAG: acyltransferase [Acidobacteriota bacterium]PYX40946.1 MAG: acyltransferase [Acidobacteriota bacterium]